MRPRRARLLLAAAIAFLYLYPFPYFEKIRSANELPRVYLTMAMVDDGTVAIDRGVRRWGTTADVSPSKGRFYSNKAPGSSMLAIPAYLVLKAVAKVRGSPPTLRELTWTFRFGAAIVPSLLFLVLLSRFLSRYTPDPDTHRLAVGVYAIGTMAMTYSVLFIAHQLAAIAIATAFILSVWVVEDGADERWLWVAGFAAGCAPLCDYQAAFAGIPLAAYLLWHVGIVGKRWRAFAGCALASVPPMAALLLYHDAAFGSPLRTGYHASETFAHYHQAGFLGLTEFRWEAFVGSLFTTDNGLFLLSPVLLLIGPGLWLLLRRKQWWMFAITGSVVLGYILFVSSLTFWRGGWQLGPRYITAALPFAMVPIAIAMARAERVWWMRGVVVGLALVSITIYAVSSAQFPHFPEKFKNPFFELVLRSIGEGRAPPTAGGWFGLSGIAAMVPYFAVLAAVTVWLVLPSRQKWRSAALGLVIAGALLLLYSQLATSGPRAETAYQWITTTFPK